jgi:SAM-dependent methyltransferase
MHFLQASAVTLPFADGAFELVTAFELIEHLEKWQQMLAEVRRVLAPRGQFVVSTPNTLFYTESRRLTGPNPFHVREFEYEAFRDSLAAQFPFVSIFLQNHVSGLMFRPADCGSGAELRVEGQDAVPEESNFFVAVCALTPQMASPTYVHIPSAANVLRERNRHIVLLEEELASKNKWLEEAVREHEELLRRFRSLEQELEERNRWAATLDADLEKARADIDRNWSSAPSPMKPRFANSKRRKMLKPSGPGLPARSWMRRSKSLPRASEPSMRRNTQWWNARPGRSGSKPSSAWRRHRGGCDSAEHSA